ncbi:MAG: tRNA (N(6)-L-threonylcarbamoyladenosine(37)-C(2))-methylthiotransferase MtaB [Spirochaetia bacterium]|nr:tRNA (N(6)-L-threonylcarbamoyladenosine(37)-C(2))-methylthiotransferase MtaB [Spirochaetia bacterium]
MSRTFSISIYTLGCRLNQVESEAVSSAFLNAGFVLAKRGADPDIFVINTCTVTSKSEQKARRVIRKASAENPDSLVVVTGCYAQLNGPDIEKLGPNILVIGQAEKSRLLEFPAFIQETEAETGAELKEYLAFRLGKTPMTTTKFDFLPDTFSFHTRASLKVQDGCNNFCAYCRIPFARGRSESMDFDRAVETAVAIEKNGYKELVLTGVNITAYESGGRKLRQLLEAILENTSSIRIRLSSLGPYDDLDNFAFLVSQKRICPHFHLSVQSGSDNVLASMGRKYPASRLKEITDILKSSGRDPFISGDVITGFPGESDQDFEDSYNLIRDCGFAMCHVFPYSPRPETRAYRMKNRIPERISRQRAERLIALADQLYLEYMARQKGRREQVIIEEEIMLGGRKYYAGLSSNYLKVLIESPTELKAGTLCDVWLYCQPLPPDGAATVLGSAHPLD